jgi:periplasmic glucans biosynthesis protein
MTLRFTRRRALAGAAALPAVAFAAAHARGALAQTGGLNFGPPAPFSFDALAARAEAAAREPYRVPYRPAPEIVQRIDYDAHGKIQFRRDKALFADGPGAFPVTYFPLGRYFTKRVRMFALEGERARELIFSPDYFDMPEDSPARLLPADSGFAGFRLHESRRRGDWRTQDWVAFLGASYFRAIGQLGQYGLSARGLALNTAAAEPEEFPDFTELYVATAPGERDPVTVYALLDGPSVSGAYRFLIRRTEGVVMDIESRLFFRKPVPQLGVAPLTSMFWFGEHNRGLYTDWRPEVHDSDGLALWSGGGERLWRPLDNPRAGVAVSSFADKDPKGFGLMQRDRVFDHYLDGVNYDKRPSLWVEPLEPWGEGAVTLVEIPTDDEFLDNIVAFWTPRAVPAPGAKFGFRYRLHWLADEPFPAEALGRVVATRIGRGKFPTNPREKNIHNFVVEFDGGALDRVGPYDKVEAVPTAARGTTDRHIVERVPGTKRWRANFDLRHDGAAAPIELRLYLRLGGRALSETWTFPFRPPAA